jgi:hypothetical protein
VLNDSVFGALQAFRTIVVDMIIREADDPGAQRGEIFERRRGSGKTVS